MAGAAVAAGAAFLRGDVLLLSQRGRTNTNPATEEVMDKRNSVAKAEERRDHRMVWCVCGGVPCAVEAASDDVDAGAQEEGSHVLLQSCAPLHL